MDKKTVLLVAAIIGILAGAYFIFVGTSGSGPQAPTRTKMIEHFAGMPIEQLKVTRARWATQLDLYKSSEGVAPQTIADAEKNLADLDGILRDKGVDPSTIPNELAEEP